jgi:hypothetical protein
MFKFRGSIFLGVALLGGGAATNPMRHLEPNPARPAAGMGYVDFYVDMAKVPCVWTLTQTRLHRDIWGGSMPTDDRVDNHVYLAEMADKPHQLVRVESKPGAQHFHIDARAPIFDGGQRATCRSEDVDLIVVEGRIVPVSVGMSGYKGSIVAEPVDYQRKQSMPYYRAE